MLTTAPVLLVHTHIYKKNPLLSRGLFFLRVPGLEPGAFWFVAKRSIQLGYIRLNDPKYRIIG